MSERLTYQTDINEHELKCCLCTATIDGEPIPKECDGKDLHFCSEVSNAIEKLGHYEDLEKQGKLIELPCKVGDTVYEITEDFRISEFTVQDISVHQIRYADDWFDLKEFENNIFFSRAEAEAKLKEMEKNNAE